MGQNIVRSPADAVCPQVPVGGTAAIGLGDFDLGAGFPVRHLFHCGDPVVGIAELQRISRFHVGHGIHLVLVPAGAAHPHGILGNLLAIVVNGGEFPMLVIKCVHIPCVIRNGTQIIGNLRGIGRVVFILEGSQGDG